jgi:hypothetical protein
VPSVFFANGVLRIGKKRYLRQVRNAQHLPSLRQ